MGSKGGSPLLASRGALFIYFVILLVIYVFVSMLTVNSTMSHRVDLLEQQVAMAQKEKRGALKTAEEFESSYNSVRDQYLEMQVDIAQKKRVVPLSGGANSALKMENTALKEQLKQIRKEYEAMKKEREAQGLRHNDPPKQAPPKQAPPVKQEPLAPKKEDPAPPAPQAAGSGNPVGHGVADKPKQDAVRAAMLHSWRGYEKFAWGQDELRPLSRAGNNWLDLGGTVVDSLDTLLIMGLKDEYEKAKGYIANSLDFNKNMDISFFETTIRVLGGLLAAYELSGDRVMLDKAKDMGDRLLKAFSSSTGIPYSSINLATGGVSSPGWTGGATVLAEIGTVQLEFNALSRHTGDPKYSNAAMKVFKTLKGLQKNEGLYPLYIDPNSATWTVSQVSVGAMGDSFYEYLLKVWMHRGFKDTWVKEMFDESAQGIMNQLVQLSSPSGLLYIAEQNNGALVHKMDHLACFAGGMFIMGAQYAEPSQVERMQMVGKGVTETCYNMYSRMPSKLSPEFVTFDGGNDMNPGAVYNIQRPEALEAIFYMWRWTHDPKYREWGWEIFQAFERYCKIESGGYVGLRDVQAVPPPQDDTQQTFWLAETLKYLYLLFSDDSLIPLDKFVFNTEAHPLQIFDRDAGNAQFVE